MTHAPLASWRGATPHAPGVLHGEYARLEPLQTDLHAESLYAACTEPGAAERFRWLPDEPYASRAAFDAWITSAAASRDPWFFAVVDRATGRAEGRMALMRGVPEHGSIEVGHVFWGARMARSRVATEALFLLARHVFDELGHRRFEWKCNLRNQASQQAALRFGFQHEGVFRQHMVVKGENRDTAWFSMLDHEWPSLRAEYRRWLAADNFDAAGEQQSRLRAASG